jgi:hypothetical protein
MDNLCRFCGHPKDRHIPNNFGNGWPKGQCFVEDEIESKIQQQKVFKICKCEKWYSKDNLDYIEELGKERGIS